MSLSLPADAEPFGAEWDGAGVYVLRYEKPDDLESAVDRAFENRPYWFDQLQEASAVLYVGEATNVMRRLEDHQNANKRLTTLSRIGCEPVGVVNIRYYDSKEDAMHAEYNVAKRVSRQTDGDTLTLSNGEPV